MTDEQKRKQTVDAICNLLMNYEFSFEFKVVKNPKGIKIIQEVTQEEMDMLVKQATK